MNTSETNAASPGNSNANTPGHSLWATRPQRLIDTIRSLCTDWLHEPLRRCLIDFEANSRQSTADISSRNEHTHQGLGAGQKKRFKANFVARIDTAFDQLGMPPAKPKAALKPEPLLTLALLETVQHDLDGALAQLITRSETRHGAILLELGYRMALLIGAPPLDSTALPFGPQSLAAAFRHACSALELSAKHELLLAQSLESCLVQGMQPLYELINGHLRTEGILPNLRPFGSPRPPLSSQSDAVPIEPYHAPADPRAVTTHVTPVNADGKMLDLQTRFDEVAAQTTLRAASARDLHDALSALQRNFRELDPQLRRELRRAPVLKQELLDQLNMDHSFGADRVELSVVQLRALEQCASLFEAIVLRLPSNSIMARALIEELQLPIMRVALTDPTFFTQPDHPATQWLRQMVEGARYWLDPQNGKNTGTLGKAMLTMIERAATEKPDADLYASITMQLRNHLLPLQYAATEAEHNNIQSLLDYERREQARARADEIVSRRSENTSLSDAQHALIDEAWRDALALTILRHGENSEAFGVQRVITDQLLGRAPAGDRHKLQQEVELGLHQIGMSRTQAAVLTRAAIDTGAAQTSTTARLAERLRSRAAQPAAQAESTPSSRIQPQLRDIHKRLLALPSGTWFEFAAHNDSPARRVKLSVCSPASGRTLFVDSRGKSAAQVALAELAEAITTARVRELPGSQDLFENAWRTLDVCPPQPSQTSESGA